ncbi:MAG: ribosomal RNA processing protein [Alyxoria varia]|nr:MAG: ribosomal RNA processing protein [Alyxoria varia]
MSAPKRRKTQHDSSPEASFSDLSNDEGSELLEKTNGSSNKVDVGRREAETQSSEAAGSRKRKAEDMKDDSRAEEQDATPQKSFQELGIIEPLCDACTSLGFKHPTPIQNEAIPWALQGRDVIGLAETGSGKTAAFALPILQTLMEKPQAKFALVLAPTRELALQTQQQFQALGSLIAVRAAAVVGGVDQVSQAIELAKGPHVIVATPGRLLEHLENTKGFHLRQLRYLVLDEADRLLDMNFGKEIDKILKALPRETRNTFLFSATMSSGVSSLQRASLRNPVKVSVSNDTSLAVQGPDGANTQGSQKPKHTTVKNLVQRFLFRPHKDKDLYLLYLLNTSFDGYSTILFARTVHETDRLTQLLRLLGKGAIPLHGQLSQSSRLSALNKFKAHSRDILVATDVASRGLDIPSVDLVLNYDLPGDDTTYIHRVGRTARAGKSGMAVSFVSQYDVEVWLRIEKALGRKIDELSGVEESEVRVLAPRVGEAQREATRALREAEAKKRKNVKGKKRSNVAWDERDLEEAA